MTFVDILTAAAIPLVSSIAAACKGPVGIFTLRVGVTVVSTYVTFVNVLTELADSSVTRVTDTIVHVFLVDTCLSGVTRVQHGGTTLVDQNDLTCSPVTSVSIVAFAGEPTVFVGACSIGVTIVFAIGTLVNVGTADSVSFISIFAFAVEPTGAVGA